jgi:sugar (pentulose or hexulose) kinase
MPCLFNYFLSGEKVNEYTIATTTQLYDQKKDSWAQPILQALGIPPGILGPVVKPGTVIGKLLPEVSQETGLKGVPVIAVGSHDTASAVAAVPAKSPGWAFLSSGTWSLIGCEVKEPIINEQTMEYDLTNEGGVENTVRLLKNVMGLWIVQECRRYWAQSGQEFSYQKLNEMAEKAPAFRHFIDVNDSLFLKAGKMPENVQSYCQRTSQNIPEDEGAIIRCVLESLAFKYREVVDGLQKILNKKIDTLHIVGGGSQNRLLCQLTANATAREVVTGPVEATAAGNIAMQCITQKDISSLSQAREILGNSFNMITYAPSENDEWETAYRKYLNITTKNL